MRLLVVVPTYWPAVQYGGPIFALRDLNRSLAENGFEISVYTTNTGIEKDVPADKAVELDGTSVTYFSCNRWFEFGSSAGWQFSSRLKRALAETIAGFDLIYIASIWNYPSAVAARYSLMHHKPYIISPRGHLYQETMESKWWKKAPYYRLVMANYLQKSAAIHYTSEDEAEKCHARLGLSPQPLVIPNGIDLSRTQSASDEQFAHLKNKRIILFLGRINWKKGLDMLIPAFAALRKTHTDTHLLIAGGDSDRYRTRVMHWIEQHDLTNDVTLSGHLNEEQKYEALSRSEIFVLPSYSENFGNAVLEAMACGVPVVISNQVGLWHDVNESGAGTVISMNQNELTSAMARYLDHPELAREAGERGKRLVREKFTWEKIARQMGEAFRRIAGVSAATV